MKYFVRVENFMQMQMGKDDFLGFFTTVRYFESLDCEEKQNFINILINTSAINIQQFDWQHNHCYTGEAPLCIITEGIVGINGYKEYKKTLLMLDMLSEQIKTKELDSKENLEF